MKKILLAITLCAIFTLSATAQNKMNYTSKPDTTNQMKNRFGLSIGIDEGIPVGNVSKYSSFVMGASIQGEYHALKALGITLSANYLYFLGKDGGTGLSFIPVMGGINFYITPKIYLAGQLGPSFYVGKDSESKVYLTYAQGIGFRASNRISLLAKYEGVNVAASKTYSFAGLRIAYNLNKL